MKRLISLCTVVLALGLAGVAGARSDTYLPSNQPLVKGTVVATDDHSVTVDSFNGERMTFTIDSRTVMPTDLAVGTRVKVEFHAMENGSYHAGRVSPFQPTDDEIASMRPVTVGIVGDRDGDGDVDADDRRLNESAPMSSSAQVATDGDRAYGSSATTETSSESANRTDAEDRDAETLPRTAGQRQGLWMIGLCALGIAGSLWLVRGDRDRDHTV